jgi:hypothetical protein
MQRRMSCSAVSDGAHARAPAAVTARRRAAETVPTRASPPAADAPRRARASRAPLPYFYATAPVAREEVRGRSPPRRASPLRRARAAAPRALAACAAALIAAASLPVAAASRLASGSMIVVALGDATNTAASSKTVPAFFYELDVSTVASTGSATLRQSIPILGSTTAGTNVLQATLPGVG